MTSDREDTVFQNRIDAGRRLGEALRALAKDEPLVVGLARGGVVVASEVARALDAPLDVMVARKIGAPGNPEFAIGAVAPDLLYLDPVLVATARADERYIARTVEQEKNVMVLRERLYRGHAPAHAIRGRTIILVDDGLATGMTAAAAVKSLQASGAARVILAVPVGAHRAVTSLARLADEVVCLEEPADFRAVGQFYGDFGETTDQEVTRYLARAAGHRVA
jgi:predicted phosphoribosyltransferase